MSENELFKTILCKAMAECSRRELCIKDIRNRLVKWGVTNDDSEKITGILIREKFIDESRYAAAFVRDKIKYNKWGKIKIAFLLRDKELAPSVIKSGLESIEDDLYNKILRELIDSQRGKIKAKSQYEMKAKLLRYGLSKGFESSLLYDILNVDGD